MPSTSEPILPLRDGVILTWAAESFRSHATAAALGLEPFWVPPPNGAGPLRKAFFYPVAFLRTLRLLRRRRPATVVCLNQPPFLPLACAVYGAITGTPYLMDFHSGAIGKRVWRPFRPLYKALVRRSPATLCHNHQDAAVIRAWGGRPVPLLSLPLGLDRTAGAPAPAPTILAVCSFAEDEPTALMLEVMRARPEVRFRLTGRYQKAGLGPDSVPSNVTLLGFVPYETYLDELCAATAVMTLSTRGHIMQMAAEEALTVGVPILTNRSPAIEEVFGEAGVYCALTREGLLDGLDRVVAQAALLRGRVGRARAAQIVRVRAALLEVARRTPALFGGAR